MRVIKGYMFMYEIFVVRLVRRDVFGGMKDRGGE